jgi:sensor domain CHASE-containing protein
MAEHANELIALIGVMFFLLISVLAWIGNRVHTRLDNLTATVDAKFEQIHTVLSSIERDLRGDLVDLDRRISRLETRCDLHHHEGL